MSNHEQSEKSAEVSESKQEVSPGEALTQAQAIIAAAEERAKEIEAQAQAAFEEARRQGFDQGYAQGRLDAAGDSIRLIEHTVTFRKHLEAELGSLALAVAENVISSQVTISSDVISDLSARALSESVLGSAAQILVHPDDAKALKKDISKLQAAAPGVEISIEEDDSLAQGGCRVRTELGEIDASIAALVASVAERFELL